MWCILIDSNPLFLLGQSLWWFQVRMNKALNIYQPVLGGRDSLWSQLGLSSNSDRDNSREDERRGITFKCKKPCRASGNGWRNSPQLPFKVKRPLCMPPPEKEDRLKCQLSRKHVLFVQGGCQCGLEIMIWSRTDSRTSLCKRGGGSVVN